jgi:formylglycine-generating enzyme required for sulfatase activity
MGKDTFLANLQKFLNDVVCDQMYASVSKDAKQDLRQDIEEFIRDNDREYSLQELQETFTSAQIAIGLFMEYRDAKLLISEPARKNNRFQAMEFPVIKMKNAEKTMAIQTKEWREPVTGMLFVWVPEGYFQMGCGDWDEEGLSDEKPVHEVFLDGFWIGKFAVTVAQYMKFVKSTDSHFPQWIEKDGEYNIATGTNDFYKKLGRTLIGETYPIVGVSWYDAVAFAEWLSENSENTFSLPTEAQWEYAARSGGKLEKYSGGVELGQVAWYCDNSNGVPHPVGTKSPNGLGIHNMCGNVSEWCQDIYSRFAYEKHARNNPIYLGDGTQRVVRGGSYNYGPRDVRCTDRSIFVPEVRTNDLGFRLIRKP